MRLFKLRTFLFALLFGGDEQEELRGIAGMSWFEMTLGDVFRVKHGFAFKSQYFSETGTHVVFTPGNFYEEGGFRSRPGKDRFYVADIPENFVLHDGDLIVAMTEQGPGLLGSSALIPEDGKYLHNQRLGLIQNLDRKKLDKNFLYYPTVPSPYYSSMAS